MVEIVSKLLANVNKIAGILGYIAPFSTQAAKTGSTVLDTILLEHEQLLTSPHFPNLDALKTALLASDALKAGLGIMIAGWLGKELDIPYLSKYGKPLQSAGGALITTGILGELIILSGGSPGRGNPTNPTPNPRNIIVNYGGAY